MNQHPSQKRDGPRSILTTLQHLFIPGKDPAYIYWILGGITFLGLIMRLWQIHDPIEYDEAYTFIYFATRKFRHILADYSAPNNHILHTLLVWLSYKVLGAHVWIVRLPALAAGALCIPAAFFAARRIFEVQASLGGAALVAVTPWFINYSANGRGYTLIVLLSLLLANLAGLLVRRPGRDALAAFAVTAALGFYTIPIFLYPMAGISLWVLATYLTEAGVWKEKWPRVGMFLAACGLGGLLTLLLYSPVIFFGTGWDSITSNDFVASRDGSMFVENLLPRASRTWESWMTGIASPFRTVLVAGFLLSLVLHRKISSQRMPLPLFLVLAIAALLPIQQVVPLARVWIYLEAFFMMFAGAGLVWSVGFLLNRLRNARLATVVTPAAVLLAVLLIFSDTYLDMQQGLLTPNRNDMPEEFAAGYLAGHLQAGDKILATAPVDFQTAYYLFMHGVPYEVFYQRSRPAPIQNAVVVLRATSRYNTPEQVLEFYQLSDGFDLAATRLLFEYGPLQIYSIPAR